MPSFGHLSQAMYFRADKRDFSAGDTISSANEFNALNPQGSQYIEDIFERLRPPAKPARSGSLFLFIEERAAKKHWSKMTGGNLYSVSVDPLHLSHCGDMRIVDQAFVNRADLKEVERLVANYWAGELTENPVIEVLVPHAQIVSILSKDQQERIAYLKSWAMA